MRLYRWAVIVLMVSVLSGCSGMRIEDLADTEPRFDLFDYFAGKTRAYGIFQGRGGELKRQFVVDIQGDIENNQLTLTEDFVYADGEQSQRIWVITRLADGRYSGKAADVIGVAQGQSAGSALNWRYTLELPYGKSSIQVNFDDWMFLQPDNILINRAKVRKFGFTVGEVTLVFKKDNLSQQM